MMRCDAQCVERSNRHGGGDHLALRARLFIRATFVTAPYVSSSDEFSSNDEGLYVSSSDERLHVSSNDEGLYVSSSDEGLYVSSKDEGLYVSH
jgi:hypothetical protein